jgi:arginase family enzyme
MRASGVRIFTMREIDERGMSAVMDEAVILASRNTAGFHVTMDMDFVDPSYAPGSAPRSRAVQPIGRAISRWRRLPIPDGCSPSN